MSTRLPGGPADAARRGGTAAEPTERPAGSATTVVLPGFDGLRAIAALLVLVVHVAFYSGLTFTSPVGVYTARGEVGVEVFFLISGFLLYRPFAAAHLRGHAAPDAPGFFVRRLLRIIPLYWLALVVALNVLPADRLGVQGLPGLLQTAFLLQGYRRETAIQGLTQGWTLNIEFAFYLSIPVYAWLLVRRRRAPRDQLRVELVALGVIFVVSRVLHYRLIGSDVWWADGWTVWLPVWWDLFAMGMLLAVLSCWYAQNGRTPAWARWRWFGGACWLVAVFFFWVASTRIDLPRDPMFVPDRSQDMGRHLFYGLFGFFLILPAVFGPPRQGLVRRFLSWRPMAYLGLISYGIYLWHTTVIELVMEHAGRQGGALDFVPFLLVVIAITCAVSTLTYFLVERPCTVLAREWARALRARRAGRGGRGGPPGAGGASGPGGAGAGVGRSATDGRWSREVSSTGHGTLAVAARRGHPRLATTGPRDAAIDHSDGDPARTLPLRTGRRAATYGRRTPGVDQWSVRGRAGGVPATWVPPDAVPSAPAPRAPSGGEGQPGRWVQRFGGRSAGVVTGRRLGHIRSRLRDETR
ncbi:acyltransferase family protein [Parafrankia sp. FMc2]|uniref:acyltransferase family protein n=1 Tax=Parafrankia sp. FMc2 TaxID=3233196 RepID=UPI0034D67C78